MSINIKEILIFYSLLFLTVFSVYFTPIYINKPYFLILLFLALTSKKDFFWFAFVFILLDQPGLLFHGSSGINIHRIPFYNITTGISFDFYDLFFISLFIKALLKGKTTKLILKRPLIYLLIFLIFLFLISFVYGINTNLIISHFRKLTVFTLFISFPFLVYKKEDLFKFMYLIFPIVFLNTFSQFFHIISRQTLYSFLLSVGPSSTVSQFSEFERHSLIRPTGIGAILTLFSIIFTLFLIEKKDYPGKKSYLYLIFLLCIISIYISATRGWIIMTSIILLLYFFFVVEKKTKISFLISISALLYISYSLIPTLKSSMDFSSQRISKIKLLLQGDVTAGGTSGRIDKRLPKVLKGFKKNPIFGWGFSTTYEKHQDPHVGTFNILLQSGIFGLLLFVILWIKYLKMILLTRKRLSADNVYRKSLLVLVISFLGILILQLTTHVFFAFDLRRVVAFFTIIFICFSEFFVKEALKLNKSD